MSNSFSFSPKGVLPWVKNINKVIGTGFGIKVCTDSYNRMADNSFKKVVKKGENRKALKVDTKKLEEKRGGIEDPKLAAAMNDEIKEEYKEVVTEYAQTNLELGDSCKGVVQDIRSAKACPAEAETATLTHIASRDHLPGIPAKENGMVLEYADEKGELLETETLSITLIPGDKSNATSQATVQLKNNKGKAGIKVKEDQSKGAPSSFASISNNLPWQNPEVSITVTTLNVKTGVIEQRVLSKQETKAFLSKQERKAFLSKQETKAFLSKQETKAFLSKQETKVFQGVLPQRNYVAVKTPPRDFNGVAIVLVLVSFCSLVGFPFAKSLKKKFDSFFFSEK